MNIDTLKINGRASLGGLPAGMTPIRKAAPTPAVEKKPFEERAKRKGA